jgi:surfeit locus 1 family protein
MVLLALGTWQVQRRAWKLDLIARAAQRVTAAAVPAPGPAEWSHVNAAVDEYRHVQVRGVYAEVAPALVQAVTERGPGFWVLVPLRQVDGSLVLVNRGFVTAGWRGAAPRGAVTVTGLLRLSEPGGGFLRHNVPAEERWYSRDVQAIAAARGLGSVAPYFIDADDSAVAEHDEPQGGLTVLRFTNNHLVYAVTWYTLALMVAGAFVYVIREERRAPTG